jgi:hypothetical protein
MCYPEAFKMRTASAFEMLEPAYETTRGHIAEDSELNIYCLRTLSLTICEVMNSRTPWRTALIFFSIIRYQFLESANYIDRVLFIATTSN